MKNNLFRYLTILFCCALLFTVISTPIRASASATVAIGFAGAGTVAVSWPVAVGVLLLIGMGLYADDLSTAIADATNWISSDTVVSDWAHEAESQGVENGSIVVISPELLKAMQVKAAKEDKKLPTNIPFLYVPTDMTSLNTLSQADLFGADMLSALEEGNDIALEGNKIAMGSQTILNTMRNDIAALPSVLQDSFAGLTSSFTSEFTQFKEWYVNINNNLKTEVHQIPTWLSNINTNMKSELGQVKGWLSDINSNVKNEVAGVKTLLVQIRDTSTTTLSSAVLTASDAISAKIDEAVDSITYAISTNTTADADPDDEEKKKFLIGGVNLAIPFFGSGKDYIAEYAAGFGAAVLIFNQFAEIPYFNTLLFVSLLIGCFGVFLGILMNAAQSDKSSRFSGKHSRVGVV